VTATTAVRVRLKARAVMGRVVVPAQAGTQCRSVSQSHWIPAFAGMTLLPAQRRLPLLQELESLGGIETGEQFG
jgi:hypothetical protein